MIKEFRLINENVKRNAINFIDQLPVDEKSPLVINIKEMTRTLDQNAKFHAICENLSRSKYQWAGKERSREEWKVLLVSGHAVATGSCVEVVTGLEGELINIRESTAKMGVKRGSSLIEYSMAFCAESNILLKDKYYDEV